MSAELDEWLSEGSQTLDPVLRNATQRVFDYSNRIAPNLRASGLDAMRYIPYGIENIKGIDGLVEIAKLLPPEMVGVEIGSYAGESTMFWWLTGKFKKFYAIDYCKPPDGIPPDLIMENVIRPAGDLIEFMQMTSMEAVSKIPDGINLLYIDGAHTYQNVKQEIEAFLPKMASPGWIAGHDYTRMHNFTVIDAVDEKFGKPDNVYPDTSWIKRVR